MPAELPPGLRMALVKQLKLLAVILCCQALFPALAADPPASTPATEETPKPTPPITDSAATDASSSSEQAKQAADAAQAKRLRGMGWKPQVKDGQTVFCKKQVQMGTRFTTEECASGDEIDRRTRDAQNAIKKIQMQNTYTPHAT